jgi:hypothetical protein
VIVVVVLNIGQEPVAATVYVTVYVPAVLADKFTAPSLALIRSPAVELNVPPVLPVITGVASPLLQYGEPA